MLRRGMTRDNSHRRSNRHPPGPTHFYFQLTLNYYAKALGAKLHPPRGWTSIGTLLLVVLWN